MQKEDLIGRMVISKAGRDTNDLYVVIDLLDDRYALLANGNSKKVQMPKKKKLKHLVITDVIDQELKNAILLKDKNVDFKIKRFLKFKGIGKEV
ncbi:LSU ribosomal protein L14E [Clostridium fallax]|uniref:Ribosomal protein L14E/L6E/L27E n=1 Tax=Clostridium fallax TaxID=1533 RepID=A0A1M4TRJ1_9CLOT|nr:RNA-binding protein [Clostridium fallax]SHE47014.1 hypothetical protein SAMN05443638_10382 [Clostridium fallax]SQB22434.1 LSU ribosomal protein L14E [Clostridium fallax]